MDEINYYLGLIEEILKTKDENECRKDVFETLDKLIQRNPERIEEIQNRIQALCVKY